MKIVQTINNRNFSLSLQTVFSLLILISILPANSEQHSAITKILQNIPQCGSAIYFSSYEINSRNKFYAYYVELEKVFPANKSFFSMNEAKDLNLMPIDKCILKGNKNFGKTNNSDFLRRTGTKTLINTDYTSHNFNKGNSQHITYVFLPISQSGIQNRESLKSIKLILEYLSTATPKEKIYISCLYGKYQSNLITAVYQFLHEYAKDSSTACSQVGSENDKAFNQMLATGNEGLLSSNLPGGLKKLYLGLTKSICEEKSAEFLQ